MKKIFLTIIYLSLIILPTELFANFFIEPSFIYMKNWSKGEEPTYSSEGSSNDYGGLLGLGGDVHRDVNIIGRAGYVVGKGEYDISPGGQTVKGELTHIAFFAGCEYVPFFPILFNNGIKWKISLYTGFIMSESEGTDGSNHQEDMGLSLSFQTGLEFMVTQRISPYFEIGYQKGFYFDEWKDYDMNQLVVLFGLRIHVHITRGLGYYY